MPSKIPPVIIRIPWLRALWKEDANRKTKALLQHPRIQAAIKEERCPICGKDYDNCTYFQSLDFTDEDSDDE